MSAQTQLKKIQAFMNQPHIKKMADEDEAKILQDVLIQRIKEIRIAKKLTQKQIAEIMGVNQPDIARWEKGEMMPSVNSITKFCIATNTRLELIY
jgi:DNA-binding transcriptional regulator YiaG